MESGRRNHEHVKQLCPISNLSDGCKQYITSSFEQMPTPLILHSRVLHAHFMSRCVIVITHNADIQEEKKNNPNEKDHLFSWSGLEKSTSIIQQNHFYVDLRKDLRRDVSPG